MNANTTLELKDGAEVSLPDQRSFHVFEREGNYYLFDRETTGLFAMDPGTYEFMALVEAGFSEDRLRTAWVKRQEIDIDNCFQVLRQMQQMGMFKFRENDLKAQHGMIASLWRHKPRRIQLLMAQGCNLGCRYCYAWRNGSNQKNTLMSWEIAKRAVDHLVEASGNRTDLQITFFGGEPLLNYPVIRKVVAYCRLLRRKTNKKFTWELITNGTLLDEKITRFLVQNKFLLFISIDGWKEMHEWNRPSLDREDWHETIVKNARYANEQYKIHRLPPVKVRANLTSKFHDKPAVSRYLAELGFVNIGISVIEPLPHADSSGAAMNDDQLDEMVLDSFSRTMEISRKVVAGKPCSKDEMIDARKNTFPLERQELKGITCGVARNTATVDNKGNIVPCHRYEGMENYILGNIWEGLDKGKTLSYYHKVNDNALARCHSCWIRDYCAGGCAWLLSAKDGSLHDPTHRECERRRRMMEDRLYFRQFYRTNMPQFLENPDGEPLKSVARYLDKEGEAE